MSRNYEMNKKIVKLTKVIYSLNVKNEICEEMLKEHDRIRKDEIHSLASKHQEKISILEGELETKQILVESLTSKNDLLLAQHVKVKADHQQQFEKHQQEMENIKKKTYFDFEKRIDEMKFEHEASTKVLSQCSFSLKEKMNRLQKEAQEQDQKHKIEIDTLRYAHQNTMESLCRQKDNELSDIKSNQRKATELLRHSMEDNYHRRVVEIECEHRNQVEKMRHDMEDAFDSRLKKVMEAMNNEIDAVKVTNKNLNLKLDEMNKELKEKDSINVELQSSFTKAIETGEKRLIQEADKRNKMTSLLNTKDEALTLTESTVSVLKEEVFQLKSKCDDFSSQSKLLTRTEKERYNLERKLMEAIEAKDYAILQRNEAENEKSKLCDAIIDMEKTIECKVRSLKLYCTSLCLTLKNTKLEQEELKRAMNNYLNDTRSIVKQVQVAYKKDKAYSLKEIQSVKTKTIEERQMSQSIHNDQILALQDEVKKYKEVLCSKEYQFTQEKENFESIKHELQQKMVGLEDIVQKKKETLLLRECESNRQHQQMKCIKHGLEKKIDTLESKISGLEKQQEYSLSEKVYLQNKLTDALQEHSRNKDETSRENITLELNMQSMKESLERIIYEKEEMLEITKSEYKESIDVLKKKHEKNMKLQEYELSIRMDTMRDELEKKVRETGDRYEKRIKEENELHGQEIINIEDRLTAEVEKHREEIDRLEADNQNLQINIQETKSQQNEIVKCHEEKKKELYHLTKEIEHMEEKYNKIMKEKIDNEILFKEKIASITKEKLELQLQDKAELFEVQEDLRRELEAHNNLKKQFKDEKMLLEKYLNEFKHVVSSEREAKIQVQGQLDILQEELTGESKMIVGLNKQIHHAKDELKRMETDKNSLIADITMKHKSERREMIRRFDTEMNCLDGKLRLTSKDLESSFVRLSKRESRPEDVEKIQRIELELHQCLERETKMKNDMVYYKNELKNREENYNSIFAGTNPKHSVGVLNALNYKKTSGLQGKENGKRMNLRSRRSHKLSERKRSTPNINAQYKNSQLHNIQKH